MEQKFYICKHCASVDGRIGMRGRHKEQVVRCSDEKLIIAR